jgi:hypothetical protein
MRQEQRIMLQLAPQRPGNLTIGAVSLVAGGKTVAQSRPVMVKVVGKGSPLPNEPPAAQQGQQTQQGQQNQPGQQKASPDPDESPQPARPPTSAGVTVEASVPETYAGKQAFLLAHAPTRPLFAGEPLFVEYLLYTRSDVPLTGIRLETAPRLSGFVAEQAPANSDEASRVRVKGQAYDVRVLWRGAVTALGPGKATLDSMTVALSIGDMFGRRRYSLSSEPVALAVRSVPAEGRPADWIEGIVGSFALKASLDRTAVRVGESVVLTVEVTGSGNLRGVRPPDVSTPSDLRVSRVPAQDLDELVVDVGGVSGRRTFQYLLTPEKEGDFEIGRVDLPFFNGVSGHFERARSEILSIAASTARGTGRIHQATGPAGHDPVTAVVSPAEPFLAAPVENNLPTALIFSGMTLPMAFWIGAEAVTRRRRSIALHGDQSLARKALSRARGALDALGRAPQTEAYWGILDGIIRNYLLSRFGLPAGLAPDEVRKALASLGVPVDVADALGHELDACAFGRFAPSAALDRDRAAAIERVRDRLRVLDRTRRPAGGTVAT